MSPSSLYLRARVRVFCLMSVSIALATGVLVWTATQGVGARSDLRKQLSRGERQSDTSSISPANIRQISLITKDLVYDPVGQRIYASLPSSAPNGNSLVPIEPVAGTVGTPVPIGSEPGKLAISDNSQFIYASLDGSAAVRRFDIASQTAGLQFTLGSDSLGNYFVNDIAVMPGQPHTVAVARRVNGPIVGEANVAIYDDAAVRLNTTQTGVVSVLQFVSPTTLYGYENASSDFGFRTMSVSSSGVTVTSSLGNYISGFGVDIRAAAGMIYATSGAVLNPATSMLVGTFAGITSGLVVPDPAANRVYFLTGVGSSGVTLKAFDLTTFMPTGTLSIPGVSGTPGSFIKWGSDGLAFRTSGNQVFLLSIADIVPVTPSSTPTPLQVAAGVSRLPLSTNDLVYDSNTQKVYASLPSSAGTFGNSLAPIDPQTATMGNPVAIGSEPKGLALSDNGQYIYTDLSGGASVRKFDVALQSPQIQFALGAGVANAGPFRPNDMAVVPSSPSSIAISRIATGNQNLAVFDDGIQRGNSIGLSNTTHIEFSSVPTTLYAFGNGFFKKFSLSSSGLTDLLTSSFMSGFGDIRYDNGRLYTTDGGVYDPEAQTLIGTIANASGLVLPDSANGRVYYLTGLGSSTLTLKSFDVNTLAQTGTLAITGISGTPGSFIKAGPGTLAFRTSDQVYFVAVSSLTSMTAIPTPTPVGTGMIQLPVAASDLVYDSSTQKIYASLPSSAGGFGNSLAPIDPLTGNMSMPIFIGSEPKKLAISNNGQFIYAGLDGVGGVRRFDVASQTAGLQFSLGTTNVIPNARLAVGDMAVLPDNAGAVAISRHNQGTNSEFGVVIYDGNTPRPTTVSQSPVIEFSTTSAKLYGYNNESTEFGLRKMIVNSSGVSVASTLSTSIQGFGVDIKYSNGNLYSSTGRGVNAETGASLGTFPGVNTFAFVPDAAVRRVYYITGTGVAATIQAFDQDTFTSTGSLIIPGVSGTATNLIRWGTNGLAFTTSGGQIYFVQTDLVPPVAKVTSSTTIASSLNPSNAGQSVTITATVLASSGNPTGTIQFQDNGLNLGGPQTLVNGQASITTSTLSPGLRTITADYSGDSNFLVSGASLAQNVMPLLSINDVATTEGQGGTKSLTFTVTLSAASNQTVMVSYATADGSATAGSDYVATTGTLTFNPGETTKTISVTINGDQSFEPDETFSTNLSSLVNASILKGQGTGTIQNDDAMGGFIVFSQSNYITSETSGVLTVTINRTNDTSRAATVDYATSDVGAPVSCGTTNGLASSRCDFTTAVGTLRFGPGETQKTFVVLYVQDAYAESNEIFTITLSNLTGGAVFSGSSTATGTILNSPVGTITNTIDVAGTFVRMHYHDFLNREADSSGLSFWTGQITACGSDTDCTEVRRINVSAAFFLSIEFQQTGYLVERMYKVAYGDANATSTMGGSHQLAVPIVRFNEFLKDTQRIGQGVVVLAPGWEQALENNKQAYALEFVQTSRFNAANAFPTTMTPTQFIDKLDQNAGSVLSPSERSTAINLFGGAGDSSNTIARAQALRQVAEDADLYNAESNRAFVLAQYFGYLRRNPDDAPEIGLDYSGYDFWLNKLNENNGDYIAAEMVKAFISASEYRQRFGP